MTRTLFPWLLTACMLAGCGAAVLHEEMPVMIAASRPAPPPPEPEPRVEVEETRIRVDEKIHFEFDSAEISAVSDSLIEEIAQVIVDHPEILKLRVEGHTDNEGTPRYNQDLSERRAQSVVDRLVENGVAVERLEPQGFGLTRPIADNATEEGRAQNRRVEFNIVERAPEGATPAATGGEAGAEAEPAAEETTEEAAEPAAEEATDEVTEEPAEPLADEAAEEAAPEAAPQKTTDLTTLGGAR